MTREDLSSCPAWWTRMSISTNQGAPIGRDSRQQHARPPRAGVTTLIDMPLNSIPATTTAAALEAKRTAARKKCWVNVGFWGGVVPGNAGELRAMHRAGVFGFKCFLVPSGVPEFEHVAEQDLRIAMPKLVELGAPLLVHAELPGPIEKRMKQLGNTDPTRHSTWLFSRPPAAEYDAIALMIRLCREFVGRTHIVHLSNARALGLLRRAKKEGLPISVETCPHYLYSLRATSDEEPRNSSARHPFARRITVGVSGMGLRKEPLTWWRLTTRHPARNEM